MAGVQAVKLVLAGEKHQDRQQKYPVRKYDVGRMGNGVREYLISSRFAGCLLFVIIFIYQCDL